LSKAPSSGALIALEAAMTGGSGGMTAWIEESEAKRLGLIAQSQRSEASQSALDHEKDEPNALAELAVGPMRSARQLIRLVGAAMSRSW
jgi:hypothetical protein